MQKFKALLFIVGAVILVSVSHIILSPLLGKTLVPFSLADDEEDEDDEDEEAEEEEIEYKTVYTQLPDTVVTTNTEVPRYDSDRDGVYDDEDPHPAINEFLIVLDNDNNGIDDQYESK